MPGILTLTKAWVCEGRGSPLKLGEIELPPLKDNDIEISVKACGLCHSDLHLVDNDWGVTKYPFAPGHEIIGVVSSVGKNVVHTKTGDRVGVGWLSGCCGNCLHCLSGEENFCSHQEATCVGRSGGFAEKVRVNERLVFKIPEGISDEHAAPLLCGGVTVFSPLIRYKVAPLKKIAIVGLGGLGHLAVQFAKAFGCQVTVISTSSEKRYEAEQFGACEFLQFTDKQDLLKHRGKFDLILSTATADLPWMEFLGMLAPKGTVCVVGGKASTAHIPIAALIAGSKGVSGSNIGGHRMMENMLEFAAFHNIHPQIEIFPVSQINEAFDKLRKNEMRYRGVIRI